MRSDVSSVETLLFDMDGVLVDSVGHWTHARDEVLRTELGIETFDTEEFIGLSVYDEYDLLAEQYPVSVSKPEYVELIDNHASDIYGDRVRLLPGVRSVLAAAREADAGLGIVSASARHRIEIVLDRFDLEEPFDVVVGVDEIDGESKPDPALYETAMGEIDAAPDGTVVVEDSVHGVMAAKRAGAYCLRFDHEWARGEADADETFTDPEPLCDRLLTLLD